MGSREVARTIAITLIWLAPAGAAGPDAGGVLEIRVRESGRPVPARVHLQGPDGEAVRAPGLPFFRDHFDCGGDVRLELAAGRYRYAVERGPEYSRARGEIEVHQGKTAALVAPIARIAHLSRRGWWSGELHVHRAVEDLPLLLRAEDLHFAPVLTVWNKTNLWARRALPDPRVVRVGDDRAFDVLGCEDERRGGALLYYRLSAPLDFRGDRPEHPSPMVNLERARALGAWIDIEKPFWWDVPTWVASGRIDSIGLANNHMCRSTMYEDEAWGRPRDAERLPPPRGNGFWTQELYYRLLDCGFRIPPSAGSASGVLPNPVGYNRVYVHLPGAFSVESWWEGLRAGRSFVTNGPLLLVEVGGVSPGGTIHLGADGAKTVAFDVELAGNDPLEVLEVVVNGEVVRRLPSPPQRGRPEIPPLRLVEPGWLVVRAIAAVPHTFRFASSAPVWIDGPGDTRRVDRDDVEFFIAWIRERQRRIERGAAESIGDLANPDHARALESVLAPHRRALAVFESLLERATR